MLIAKGDSAFWVARVFSRKLLLRSRPVVQVLSGFWLLVILWFEVGTFYSHVAKCHWPGTLDKVRDHTHCRVTMYQASS